MNNRRLLSKELKRLRAEVKFKEAQVKEAEKKIESIRSKIDQIEFMGMEQFDKIFEGKSNEEIEMNLSEFNGIYIVKKRNPVQLVKFYDLVKNEPKPRTIQVELPERAKGVDGKEVDASAGSLLIVSRQEEINGFHFANVAPSTESAQLQYEYALFKLGLGVKPSKEIPTIVIDGQFRQALIDKSKEPN